jgi:hypothetical protein
MSLNFMPLALSVILIFGEHMNPWWILFALVAWGFSKQ